MLYEYLLAAAFYLVFSSFALFGLLLLRPLFSEFRSAYAVAKLVGLIVFGYIIWLLGSLNLFDYQHTGWLIALWLITILASVVGLLKYWPAAWQTQLGHKNIYTVLLFESLSLLFYFIYLWLRSHNVEIHGTERFMDMALLSGISKTNFFPPTDSWLAGEPVNYYYYGHYLWSLVGRLISLGTHYVYTFTLGIIFSTTLVLVGYLIKRLTAQTFFAVIGAGLVVLAGTMTFAWGFIDNPIDYAFTRSTRLYEPSYIINEIPSYSFTVGDLHAHLLALPFFILALFFLHEFFIRTKLNYYLLISCGVIFATSGLINSWDLITLAWLFSLLIIYKLFSTRQIYFLIPLASVGLALGLMLPFLWHFQSGAQGIGLAHVYVATHNLLDKVQHPSPLWGWLGIWGGYLLLFIICLAWLRRQIIQPNYLFPIVLICGSLAIIVGVEVIFVKDIYSLANPPYFRANTVFKFGFHAWVLLSISASVLVAHLTKRLGIHWLSLVLVCILLGQFTLGLVYPVRALKEFYFPVTRQLSLDGLSFMQTLYPEDLATINWLNANVSGRFGLVEAVGDSYTDYGRFSVFTGLINPVNWPSHEWGWRFNPVIDPVLPTDAPVESGWSAVAARSGDVKLIYESTDLDTTKQLLNKYGAHYVYVGDLERQTYPSLSMNKFYQLGTEVFSSGNSRLFAVQN